MVILNINVNVVIVIKITKFLLHIQKKYYQLKK